METTATTQVAIMVEQVGMSLVVHNAGMIRETRLHHRIVGMTCRPQSRCRSHHGTHQGNLHSVFIR